MTTLKTPIEQLPQIGPRYVLYLHKLGIRTAGDLLFHFPFRYDDFSDFKPIRDIELGQVVSVKGEILEIRRVRTKRQNMTLTQAAIQDDSGVIQAVWFNQPFLTNSLRAGMNVSLSGKVVYAKEGFQLSSPAWELLGKSNLHTGRLVPVYHETEGLSSKWLRVHIKPLLPLADEVVEFLPEDVLERQDLLGLGEAIRQIHFPEDGAVADCAKRRLAFDELFLVQLYMQRQRQKWRGQKAMEIRYDKELEAEIKYFLEKLPFKLTDGQKIAVWKIIKDMEKDSPMNRLLEGDVGSGKTLVALLAVLVAVRSGYQALIMAPTEILAEQHFRKLISWLEPLGITTAWLTGSQKTKERREALAMIESGEAGLVIGTHAVIQDKVVFKNLALAIIDEQHRFGVAQRLALRSKASPAPVALDGLSPTPAHPHTGVEGEAALNEPHLLMMTATPIPRTLAMSYYADLDVSTIDELPPGRTPIVTKLVNDARRDEVIDRIRGQLAEGRQIYWVCPLIEESESIDLVNATQTHEALSAALPGVGVGLLHSRMPPAEKKAVMSLFVDGVMGVLVSTTVIEVGVDVPNASLMVIEHSERFGLSQLHQLRGRVGRGAAASACVLLYSTGDAPRLGEVARARLKAMVETQDGFEISRRDLEIRGPGEFLGARQSGAPLLRFADLATDAELLAWARAFAPVMLDQHAELAERHVLRWMGGKGEYLKA